MTSMKYNCCCGNQDMCIEMCKEGVCKERCRNYRFEPATEAFYRERAGEMWWGGLTIPYDMQIGYIHIGKPATRGFRIFDRKGEVAIVNEVRLT